MIRKIKINDNLDDLPQMHHLHLLALHGPDRSLEGGGLSCCKALSFITIIIIIIITRPKPAYGRQGLDWIVGPGYSFVVFSNKTIETNQNP